MNNIIDFPGLTHLDIDASKMLRAIADESPRHAFVICWPKGTEDATYHCSTCDVQAIFYELQKFMHKQMNGDFQ